MESTKTLKKEVRKAYFSGTLDKYFAKLQEKELDPEVLPLIEELLGGFKEEELAIIKDFKKFLPMKGEKTYPSLSELMRESTPEREAEMKTWLEEMDKNMANCVRLAREQRDRISGGKHIDSKKILDLGLFFITNEFSFNQVLAYREMLYKVKIIEIIDTHRISRREAQDRAEVTPEYFEYNVMKKNLETLKELEIYAKKYQSSF